MWWVKKKSKWGRKQKNDKIGQMAKKSKEIDRSIDLKMVEYNAKPVLRST